MSFIDGLRYRLNALLGRDQFDPYPFIFLNLILSVAYPAVTGIQVFGAP